MQTKNDLCLGASRIGAAAAAAAIWFGLLSGQADAISRYNSTAMSCDQIQSAIAAEGEVVLRWTQPPDILRYDRYVAGNQFCDSGQRVAPASVPSAGQAACGVYACEHFDPNFLFPFLPEPPDHPARSR